MIPRCELSPISTILSRLGVEVGRRGRTGCPLCGGGGRSGAFSYNDENGLWHCFRCGRGGDTIALVERCLNSDFRGALRWLGLEPGKPTALNPEQNKQRKFHEEQQIHIRFLAKQLRDEHFTREVVIGRALEVLRAKPEHERAWNWLVWALIGIDAIEYRLDHAELQLLKMQRKWRAAA